MNLRWDRLGGRLGIAFCVAGLALVFLGWNGAASWDRVPSQFPYLISGGIAGLCLVVIGAALLVVETQRADRASLEARLDELRDALDRIASATSAGAVASDGERVLVGEHAFHRPGCPLVEGRGLLPTATYEDALARGLEPCRTCAPSAAGPAPRPRTRGRRAAR